MRVKQIDNRAGKKSENIASRAFFKYIIAVSGKTQRDIARELGVDHSYICRVISGERRSKRVETYIKKLQGDDPQIDGIFEGRVS